MKTCPESWYEIMVHFFTKLQFSFSSLVLFKSVLLEPLFGKNRIKLWEFDIIKELSNNPLEHFNLWQVHYILWPQFWNSITGITIVYTHLLCHTASLSRAWQVSRRHVLHFRWDLCFIRIAYHEAPILSNQTVQNLKWKPR